MNCPICQEEIDYFDFDMEFCPHCGNDFDQEDVELIEYHYENDFDDGL